MNRPSLRDRLRIHAMRIPAPWAMRYLWRGQRSRLASVADIRLPGGAGDIGARVYTPVGSGPFPLMVYCHGGGFVLCNLDTHDALCRDLSEHCGCVVVSLDYRLAPEHPFPAGVEDCLAATRWLAAHAATLGADPARLVVAGDSAGGNLVAVLAQQLHREVPIAGQLLVYPVMDLASQNYIEPPGRLLLSSGLMRWFRRLYLPGEADAGDERASPLRREELAGLPPALLITAGRDVLRAEGERYAERLRAAGVPVLLRCFEGVQHGFFGMAGPVPAHREAVALVADWVRKR